MFQNIIDLINSKNYTVLITLFALILLISATFNQIKYLCLKKACEKIAAVEKMYLIALRKLLDAFQTVVTDVFKIH